MSNLSLVTRTGRRATTVAMALLFPILLIAQNYVFRPNVRANSDPPGTSAHWTTSPGQRLIAARGDTVYCLWNGNRGGEQHIYFGRSNDGGRSFLPSVRVDNTPSGCEGSGPSLAVDDSGGIHVSWLNRNLTNAAFTYYAKSTNGGQSFQPPLRACDSLYRSQHALPRQ